MGVPGLFAFLRRRYPLIAFPPEEPAPDDPDDRADCLYVDMNHIIHRQVCSVNTDNSRVCSSTAAVPVVAAYFCSQALASHATHAI